MNPEFANRVRRYTADTATLCQTTATVAHPGIRHRWIGRIRRRDAFDRACGANAFAVNHTRACPYIFLMATMVGAENRSRSAVAVLGDNVKHRPL
jgi:hypothetical protein